MRTSFRSIALTGIFITCLIAANVIAVKVIAFGFLILPAAVVVFPISYILGDVLTEVYGFNWMKRVIWLGFFCNLIFVFFVWLGQKLPAAPFWEWQDAYRIILGFTPRLLFASFCGYLVGSFTNSIILARMKVLTGGRWLWARTIGSTIVGEGLDTAIFIVLAFAGTPLFVPVIILYHWLIKVAIEAVATPLTYAVVAWLKKRDEIDVYDRETDLNPFRVSLKP